MIDVKSNSNDEIMDLLFNKDEITWQSMIYELVSSEKMDPWDVDVSLLAKKFLERLRIVKDMDLKVSGKVLLAAAIFLKIKSNRFVSDDISALDALIASANSDESEEGLFEDEIEHEGSDIEQEEQPQIYPRTPQPRKRKVSVFDLVNALEKALNVFKRRPPKIKEEVKFSAPEKPRDLSLIMRDVYSKVLEHHEKHNKKLLFTNLITGDSKDDKVFTFIPLLHLDNQRKLELWQQKHFGDIEIELLKDSS